MHDLLDNAPCSFLRLTDDGTIRLTNATLRSLLGYDPGVLEGGHVDRILSPGARIFYQTHVFPLLRVRGQAEEIYLSLHAADGSDIPVLLNAVRREDEDGPYSDWVVVVMRRRNRLEDELLQAKRAAEEAARAKDRFLSMMSHDLRAPLSGISMAASILGRGTLGPVNERQEGELERIKEASQYVLRLVKDLLNYARLQSSRVEVRMEAVPVAAVLAQAEAMVQHLMADAGLAFTAEACAADLQVRADADRLQQVVLNLLTNAAKFTPAGGHVAVRCTRQGGHVCLHVQDTGRGIPEDRLKHIFEPFMQLERSRDGGEGVGLGLAISRELTRTMGGDLTVESREGAGATFTVRLAAAGEGAGE